MGGEGAIKLSMGLKNLCKLKKLLIGNNNIGRVGGRAIAESLKNKHFVKELGVVINSYRRQ